MAITTGATTSMSVGGVAETDEQFRSAERYRCVYRKSDAAITVMKTSRIGCDLLTPRNAQSRRRGILAQ